jgi:EAL domain-containing protein (putative c-di-GMP-specific phosphodiesterase class I)
MSRRRIFGGQLSLRSGPRAWQDRLSQRPPDAGSDRAGIGRRYELAERSLADLAAQGIRIALDDFGAGFCNFRYLKTLPLHYLKLDRSMVDGITEDPRDLAVLRAITAMATALDLEVIAEGIESEPQRLAVAREGCAFYQGFVRAQP